MTPTGNTEEASPLSPDEAFSVLGDETRLQILQRLGEADGPLMFSELFGRIDYDDTANFSYHLDKLAGHFLRESDEGYELRQSGRRIVEAVLSGAVTDDPVLEPIETERRCPLCGAPIEVSYDQDRVGMYCTECSGLFGQTDPRENQFGRSGHLGNMLLPPAGVRERTATSVLETAWAWGHLEIYARASGFCPRCSAPVAYSVNVCEDHDAADGACGRCGRRYAGHRTVRCTGCIYEKDGLVSGRVLSNTEFLAFLTAHGINPITPDSFNRPIEVMANYEENVVSTDPFVGRYTYTIGENSITLTVDEDLSVVDVTTRVP